MSSQEIFQKRRTGNLKEALTMAREKLLLNPEDIWVQRAAGWTIHDLIKDCLERKSFEEARTYLLEFENLCSKLREDHNQLLIGKIKELNRNLDNPRRQIIREAITAGKSENRQKSLQIHRQAFKEFSQDTELNESYGWEIFKQIKIVTQNNFENSNQLLSIIVPLLREYYNLNNTKPSKLHSLILKYVSKFADHWHKYINFVQWWDVQYLTEEDYQCSQFNGQTYPSLGEMVAKSVAKAILQDKLTEHLYWAIPFLKKSAQKGTIDKWAYYRLAKILLLKGDYVSAEKYIIPIVRQHNQQSWAWHSLATLFEAKEQYEEAIVCLCRGLTLGNQENLLINLRLDLAKNLLLLDQVEIAKFELIKVAGIRAENNWQPSKEVENFLNQPKIKNAVAVSSNNLFYKKEAEKADNLVYDDLDWQQGILISHQPSQDNKPARSFIGIIINNKLEQAPVYYRCFSFLSKLEPGTPLRVKFVENDSRYNIICLEQRQGEYWDLLPETIGVVNHINLNKGVISVVLENYYEGLAYYSRIPNLQNFQLGDCVMVRVISNQKRNRLDITSIRQSQQQSPDKLKCVIEGYFNLIHPHGFGFVNSNHYRVYVPAELVQKAALTDGVTIRIEAVRCSNRQSLIADTWRGINLL